MKKLCLLLLTTLLVYQSYTQIITRDKAGYGMVDNAGKTVLTNTYDKIELLPFNRPTYILTKKGKHQLYDFHAATFSAEYDEIIKHSYGKYILRLEKLYGYIVENRWNDSVKIVEPAYTDIRFTGAHEQYISARKDSLYGVLDRSGKEIIPFEIDFPVEHEKTRGFYCEPGPGKIMLLRKHPVSGLWVKKIFSEKLEFRQSLVLSVKERVIMARYTDSHTGQQTERAWGSYIVHLTVYDNETLDSLTFFSCRDTTLIEFPPHSAVVFKTKKANKKRLVSLYNPLTGEKVFQCLLKKNEYLSCYGDTSKSEVTINKYGVIMDKTIYIGSIGQYRYTASADPLVIRTCNIFTGGTSNNFPWFWSGR